MTQKKVQQMIETTKLSIKWEQKTIDRCMEQIKEQAQCDKPYNIVSFMPGYIRELQEAMNRQKQYAEQLNMLEYLIRDEEA